jgi:hypothetical protein
MAILEPHIWIKKGGNAARQQHLKPVLRSSRPHSSREALGNNRPGLHRGLSPAVCKGFNLMMIFQVL